MTRREKLFEEIRSRKIPGGNSLPEAASLIRQDREEKSRRLGTLQGRASIEFVGVWEILDEEFLDNKTTT